MPTLNTYEGKADIFVNGRVLAEAVSTRVRIIANNNKVMTMKRGLAGKSDGPREAEMTIENAIPRAGFEQDFFDYCKKGAYLRVVLKSGNQRHQFDMWVESAEINNATDRPASLSAELMGTAPESRGASIF